MQVILNQQIILGKDANHTDNLKLKKNLDSCGKGHKYIPTGPIKSWNLFYISLNVGFFQFQGNRKRSVFIPIPKKGNAKECSNYCTIALISHASKVMLKFLQARLQQYVNHELPDVQAGFRKGRGTRDQIANICWIIKKAKEFQKNIYFCFIDYAKVFHCVDHNNCGKFWKRWAYQTTWPASWETYMQIRK